MNTDVVGPVGTAGQTAVGRGVNGLTCGTDRVWSTDRNWLALLPRKYVVQGSDTTMMSCEIPLLVPKKTV